MRAYSALAAAFAALLAAPSCSPGAAPAEPRNALEARAPEAGVETKAPQPPREIEREAAAAEPAAAPAAAGAGERRCGWLSNPTPGNWWLLDRHGEWILATQGSEPVAGMEDIPDMSTAGWVEINGHYGYGCACMTITYDPAAQRVTRVADAKPKPLKQCRADKGLPRR